MRNKRGGYSGNASFTFEVERLRNVETGELVLEKDVPEDSEAEDFEYEYIELSVEGNSWFTPGKTYGLPENCYPDEGETEIESIKDSEGNDWESLITSDERGRILDEINEQASSCDDYDGPDPDDRDDDYFDPAWDNYDGCSW